MAATKYEIASWLDRLYEDESLSHMIVVCDTYDWEDYPVYVSKTEALVDAMESYDGSNMQRVMEVYSRNHDREAQLAESRAFHYD